jgi:hypothetical protein
MTALSTLGPAVGTGNIEAGAASPNAHVNPAGLLPAPFHCQEPMSEVDVETIAYRLTTTEAPSGEGAHRPVLRCRCGFQMDPPETFADTE